MNKKTGIHCTSQFLCVVQDLLFMRHLNSFHLSFKNIYIFGVVS